MPPSKPDIVSEITEIETIAINRSIRELARLKKQYGGNRWRKLKGKAYVMKNGQAILAELHWYECTGIGRVKRELKSTWRIGSRGVTDEPTICHVH
jgi:hypothetical protein